jgi:prephenate dehydrogenase
MGRWFSALFQQAGLTVLVCDRSSGVSLAELAEQSEVILISVPMSAATEVVSALAPMLRPGQLVVENGSIKSSILPALLEKCTDQVEVLGIHTMFANDISNLRDENIIVTRTERSAVLADAFESLLYKYGARLSHLDVKTHDELSAFFQSLFHCTMVALAETMRETLGSPNSIETFSTPNSRSILTTMRRVLNQNEDLLLDLQTLNREYPRTRRIYFQSMFRLLTALEHGDLETFLRSARQSRIFLDS